MSKASEWAVTVTTRPQLKLPEENSTDGAVELIAEVTDKGRLNLRASIASPERAIAFAHWILDVFGEPTP